MKRHPQKNTVVAVDLDGTLLRDDKTASEFSLATLRRLAKAGLKIMFVTGRRERIALPVLEAIGVPGWALLNNGTLAMEWPSRRRCFTHYMCRTFLAEVIACLEGVNRPPVILVDPDASDRDIVIDRRLLDADVYRVYAEHHKEFTTIADRLADSPALDRVLGMFLCEPVDDLPAYRNRLTKTMGGTVNHRALENIEYIRGHRILEIIEPHWTKWTGITELIGQFAKEPDRIYAFGDDHNDLDMLTNADVSFAPANATDAAKQAASEVVPANNNDGVAIALRRLFPEVFA